MNQPLTHRGIAALAGLLAAATLTGCGGGDEAAAGSPTEYSEAVASAWSRAEDTKVSEAQARCWGERLVEQWGIDRIRAFGDPVTFGSSTVTLDLSRMNLSQAEAQTAYDEFASCGGNLTRDKNLLVNELGLPEQMQTCISNALDAEVMEEFFVAALQDGKDTAAADVSEVGLAPALEACVEEMSSELVDSLG